MRSTDSQVPDMVAEQPSVARPAPGQRTMTAAIQRRAAETATPAAAAPAAGGDATDAVAVDPFDFSFAGPPGAGPRPDVVAAVADQGTQGAASSLPYADAIQRSFGHHDVGGIQAHQGAGASVAARALGAEAYATGNQVVFGGAPDLHTAAHEAAHVVQQRRGVQLAGGIDGENDIHERHADQVADRVVRGESAEGLLDELAPGPGGAAPVQRKLGKWLACGLLALGGVAAVIGGVITGAIPLVLVGGAALVGAVALGVSAHNDDKRSTTIEQFGNKHRDPDIDPDQGGEGGQPRPDDAPIVPEFRQVYNQLENWKIFIKTKHPDLYGEFTTEFLGEEAPDYAGQVKAATKVYKTQFRNLHNDPAQVTATYQQTIAHIQQAVKDLIDEITVWYLGKTGKRRDDVEEGLLPGQAAATNREVHDTGTDLWREKWQESIVKVNSTLARLWPGGKARLRNWVNAEKGKPANAAADMNGPIGELDYIGSLAKGIKGPPKQHIRFNPDDFDVDANLKAPPLSNYAEKVKGKVPDRERIFGRASEIPPLIETADEIHAELVQIPGIKDDPNDKFDIALETTDTPQQAATNQANEKLWKLRAENPVAFGQAVGALRDAGLLTGDEHAFKLNDDAPPDQVKNILDHY